MRFIIAQTLAGALICLLKTTLSLLTTRVFTRLMLSTADYLFRGCCFGEGPYRFQVRSRGVMEKQPIDKCSIPDRKFHAWPRPSFHKCHNFCSTQFVMKKMERFEIEKIDVVSYSTCETILQDLSTRRVFHILAVKFLAVLGTKV